MVPNRITQVRASIKVSGEHSPEAKMGRPTKKTNDAAAFINQATLLTNIQVQKRMSFCYSILLHRKELPFICFSDESRFSLGSDKRYLWRIKDLI